jgi:aspartate/methionine/tyrosine aminotransferase
MNLASRMTRLGTETAFAVSAEAARHAAAGHRVYPFHLGDMNIPTPANIMEATYRAMRDGKTGYCPNAGVPRLREVLAEDVSRSHGVRYTMHNVAIQPGGKPVIGKFILAMMNPGDEVLYPNPGYPIYESQIAFHGGRAVPYTYGERDFGFELRINEIERSITPKTRFLIFNDWHNPTGTEATETERARLAELVLKHNLYVLCDEAYIDVRYEGQSKSLVSIPGMQERCVILYTFSKKFAMTGWRLGAAIGPEPVIDAIAKLNVNDESCANHFIQYGAIEGLTGDQEPVREILRVLRQRRDKCLELLNSIKGVRCSKPEATFYLFPNVSGAMTTKRSKNYDEFRKAALSEANVSFCTRRHFGTPRPDEKESYIRFAYSGIILTDIEEGLARFKSFIERD